MKYTCPACGYIIFSGEPGSGEICAICGWEDDARQLKYPLTGGANRVSLVEAQQNYSTIGASERSLLSHVRKAADKDIKDPKWRMLNPQLDRIETPPEGKDYLESYPADTVAYYWNQGQ